MVFINGYLQFHVGTSEQQCAGVDARDVEVLRRGGTCAGSLVPGAGSGFACAAVLCFTRGFVLGISLGAADVSGLCAAGGSVLGFARGRSFRNSLWRCLRWYLIRCLLCALGRGGGSRVFRG